MTIEIVSTKIEVVHVKSDRWKNAQENERVYIGRQNTSHGLARSIWANPAKLHHGASREERCYAVAEFGRHLLKNPQLWLRLAELEGKTLGCWCKHHDLGAADLECHGDFLAGIVRDLRNYAPVFEVGHVHHGFTRLVIETRIAVYEQMAEEWRADEAKQLAD